MYTINLLKTLGGAASIMALATSANAMHLTPEQALERLYGQNHAMKAPAVPFELVHSELNAGREVFYVFNQRDNGFVILSADDRMPSLLGYSDTDTFDPSCMPPQLSWLFSVYSQEAVALLRTSPSFIDKEDDPEENPDDGRDMIPPLLISRWGQNHPYDLMCPSLGESNCVTGCVATAMAQIMKYYEYPAAGVGSHSYIWNGEVLEYDFSQSFDFDNMLYTYSSFMDMDEEMMNAVARLMYACGVSVDMNYGLEVSDASPQNVPQAVTSWFGYDPGVRYVKKAFFTPSDWEALIYAELEAGRPVIYGGETPGRYGDNPQDPGGHQFIIDGYEHPGLFHVNWGWNGMGNGYFRLSALEPDIQGTGGYEGGYNIAQTAVVGLRPAVEGSARWYPVYGEGSIEPVQNTKTQVKISYPQHMGLTNYSSEALDVELFIKAIDVKSGKEYVAEKGRSVSFSPNGGISGSIVFSLPTGLPEGEYTASVVMLTPEGNWQEILYPQTSASTFDMTVSASGAVTCRKGEPAMKIRISVDGFHPTSFVEPGKETQFSFTVRNVGEVDCQGFFLVELYGENSEEPVQGQTKSVHFPVLAPEHSFTGYVDLTYDVEPGEYYVVCYDSNGDPVCDSIPISIGVDGVEVLFGTESTIDVYSVSGHIVRKNADKGFVSGLHKGVYICKNAHGAIKIVR